MTSPCNTNNKKAIGSDEPSVSKQCGCGKTVLWPTIDHLKTVIKSCCGQDRVETLRQHCPSTTKASEQAAHDCDGPTQIIFSHYGPQVKPRVGV